MNFTQRIQTTSLSNVFHHNVTPNQLILVLFRRWSLELNIFTCTMI